MILKRVKAPFERLVQLQSNVNDYATHPRKEVRLPLRCVMVNFSLDGNSSICMPNFVLNSFWAISNTSLNFRVPGSPSTFTLMSPLRIGRREYSHANARRTSFFTIVSTPLSVCVWLSASSSEPAEALSSSVSCCCTRRRRLGDSETEESASSRR